MNHIPNHTVMSRTSSFEINSYQYEVCCARFAKLFDIITFLHAMRGCVELAEITPYKACQLP